MIDKVNDLDAAVYHTLLSTLITSGQRCTCARRVIIPDSIQGDEFLNHFIKACSAVKIGPFDQHPEPFMGSIIGHKQAIKYLQTQQDLIESGASPLLSMSLLTENTGLLSPGIMDMTHYPNPPDEEFLPFSANLSLQSF